MELVGRSRDHRAVNLVAFLSDSFACLGVKNIKRKNRRWLLTLFQIRVFL